MSAAREVGAAGGTALPIAVDVSDHDVLDAAADRVVKELGYLDVWVHNAFSTVFAHSPTSSRTSSAASPI